MHNFEREMLRVSAEQQTMYHVAPVGLRKTIQGQGLIPDGPLLNTGSGHERGVYLWDTPEVAWQYRGQGPNMYRQMDVHAVDTTGLDLRPDNWIKDNRPDYAETFSGAWLTDQAISPERISPHFLDPWTKD